MQTVKFAKHHEHWTPEKTTVFAAGATEEVSNEIAEKARAAGVLEEDDGGRPDQGNKAGRASKAEGRP